MFWDLADFTESNIRPPVCMTVSDILTVGLSSIKWTQIHCYDSVLHWLKQNGWHCLCCCRTTLSSLITSRPVRTHPLNTLCEGPRQKLAWHHHNHNTNKASSTTLKKKALRKHLDRLYCSRVIEWLMNFRRYRRKYPRPNLLYYPDICIEDWGKPRQGQ
jgi:hypothetical protein